MGEPDPPMLDANTLAELAVSVGDDASFVVELVEAYLGDAPQLIAVMQAAGVGNDAAALVRPAHTLKSSSATVGALRLAALARQLEAAGRSEVIDDAATLETLAALPAEWEATSQALHAWVAAADR